MTKLRTAPPTYDRDAHVPLRRVRAHDASAGLLPERRALWSAYLGAAGTTSEPAARRDVPLATAWIPVVSGAGRPRSDDAADDVPGYLPGSFYPAGFRDQVLAGCGTDDPVLTDPGNDVGSWLDSRLGTVDELTDADLVRCALTLNLLSQYGRTVRVFAPVLGRREIPRLFREVARAHYAVGTSGERRAAPYIAIADSPQWDVLSRVGATVRLIAHYSRNAQDVELAARWARTGQDLYERADDGSFTWRLYGSHLQRALALHHWRRRDGAAMAAALGAAASEAVALQDATSDPASRLAATHAERLVREAELKAFTGRPTEDTAEAAREVADRLGVIDPADPYSRLICGDTYWIVGADEAALDCYAIASRAGTLLGAQAAIKAAAIHRERGADASAVLCRDTAADLDEEAA